MRKKAKKTEVVHPQLAEWKKQYPDIISIVVKVDDYDNSIGFYRIPTSGIIDLCLSFEAVGDLDQAMLALANNTWIGGDHRQQTREKIAKYAQVELWKAAGFCAKNRLLKQVNN